MQRPLTPCTQTQTTGVTDPTTATTNSTETSEGSTTDEATGSSSGSGDTDGLVEHDWAALVTGELFTADLAEAQGLHDAVAAGGEEAATMLGDYGHDAMLGTTLLGTTENQSMGIDQWETLDGAQTLYSDPKFQQGFGMLFAAPPSLELFERREDWHGWGDLEATDGGDRWLVVVRGRLAEQDIDSAQALHDMVAAGGQNAAMALGDVAHVVWTRGSA